MKTHFELYAVQNPPQVFRKPSRKMIKTLRACLQMETGYPGRPYGSADINGSFFGLYNRGLLDINANYEKNVRPYSWYITRKGLRFLLSI